MRGESSPRYINSDVGSHVHHRGKPAFMNAGPSLSTCVEMYMHSPRARYNARTYIHHASRPAFQEVWHDNINTNKRRKVPQSDWPPPRNYVGLRVEDALHIDVKHSCSGAQTSARSTGRACEQFTLTIKLCFGNCERVFESCGIRRQLRV